MTTRLAWTSESLSSSSSFKDLLSRQRLHQCQEVPAAKRMDQPRQGSVQQQGEEDLSYFRAFF